MKDLTNTTKVTQYWAFHYHILDFLMKTQDLEKARQRWDRDKTDYFWNWMKHNQKMDEEIIRFFE